MSLRSLLLHTRLSARLLALAPAAAIGLGLAGCATSNYITYSKDARKEGVRLYNARQYADAAGAFRNATRQEPRDFRSHYYLGASYDALGSHQQAVAAYRSAIQVLAATEEGRLAPEWRPLIVDGLAIAVARSQNRQAEITLLETAASNEAKPENYWMLAKVYGYIGDADLAVNNYNRAVALDPKNYYLNREAGLYLDRIGQTDKARDLLVVAFGMNPRDTQVADALRRAGVVPGPSLIPRDQLASPFIPRGPIPEIDIPKWNPFDRNDSAQTPQN